jgi:excisionase family DNA binding protein
MAMEEQEAYISTTEVAIRLGIIEDAVRKRIKIGSLSGKKVGKKWLVSLESLQKPSRNGHAADTDLLIQQLRDDVSFLKEQFVATNHQLSEKDHQLSEKDEQLRALLADLDAWREQVRYKELQIAQLQDRMIQLPAAEEAERTEQGSEIPEPAAAQAADGGNALSRFWRWFVGGG